MCFIVGLTEGLHHGIRVRRSRVRASATHILLDVIILIYKSLYGGACVAHTSGGGALINT
jgi:hypothetical protein